MANDKENFNKLEKKFNALINERIDKFRQLKNDGKDPFEIYKVDRTHTSDQIRDNYDELEGSTVTVAGRLMSKRVHGKAGFSDLYDRYGKIQLYIKIDDVGEEKLKEYKTYDIGDILSITGKVFKTKTGEITIHIENFQLVCKSLRPLPEKWHGLKDPDLKYRQRYVDLIINQDVRDTFMKRTAIIKAMREFLDDKNFIEVETPILSTIAGGAAAKPFITHHNTLDMDMYLRIATELYLKRLIVGGFEKVYEIGKNFRNEGMDIRHNPEFTSIELYEAFADYNDMMEITENMVAYICNKVLGTTKVVYEDKEIDFKPPWERITMVDAVREFTNIDFNEIKDDAEAQQIAREKNIQLKKELKDCTKGYILDMIFEEFCEEKFVQPTFVLDYPVEVSPLTKKKRGNDNFTERFEGFVYGREICNAYSELNDPIAQKERFVQQLRERELGDDEAYMMDADFINALEIGMPPTGGLGIGVDRLIMFLTNSSSIRDVILFPTMKPL
ncbi:MAG: lysine--tRNA ligase [Clostridium sp.]|jgi:lysyl-tRNA synthetase class 2|uniref:lysine--tRNA ligase n=1 Tax=Clostridium sp. TaxID=1506 RepID=UPI0025B7F7AC|nr:lysine--tRNA ligase [Clostridium sp.]MCH3965637.1 lysine--tRNA ligase [Clostridium sp.]MCI1717146.1 lysine--tRNA ligase [Clostridium sp.]MCI1801449.1 lysine--tRNA ligase [Clostridium sp.]MCI1815332.1 lysine--tRNA ligase [Clostridium sp.]MCI1872198.1 lysine--tRNA ligase [Clostridium sp.]